MGSMGEQERSVIELNSSSADYDLPEMPLHVLLIIDDARAEGFFVGLALEDFFFDGARGQQAIDVARLLLSVSPYPSHSLVRETRGDQGMM